jgi:hypothetical protein
MQTFNSRPDYIPAVEASYKLFTRFDEPYWVPLRHVLISDIKIDKKLTLNDVCYETVEIIIEHFDDWQWLPIAINEDGYLLDGQHRLEVAQRKGLKFIDTVVQNSKLFPSEEKKKRKQKLAK